MEEQQKMIVGMDISRYYVQVSCQVDGQKEAETISTQMGVEQFEIPLCLFLRLDSQTWYYGEKAKENRGSKEGIYIDDLWEGVCSHRELHLEQASYPYEALMAIFIQKVLQLLVRSGYDQPIGALVYTTDDMNDEKIRLLQKICRNLPIEEKKIFYVDYQESFGAYATYGLKELWNHHVFLFYYQGRNLKVYQLYVQQKTLPFQIYIEQKDYGELEYGREELEDSQAAREDMDSRFCATLEGLFAKKIISSVYLIGDGFSPDWMKESLRLVCRNRRVFKGNNLFTKGACYAAQHYIYAEKMSLEYHSEQQIPFDVRVVLGSQEHQFEYAAKKREPWYQAGCIFEAMIKKAVQEETYGVAVELVEASDGKHAALAPVKTEVLELADFPRRPDMASRLRVGVEFMSARKGRIFVEDLGLGEFFPASGMKWERQFVLGEEEQEAEN